MNTKEELNQKSQHGDITSFHNIFSDFQGQLKSYLYRLTANKEDSEDLYQETFIKAFKKIGTFEHKSSLKTWVFTIATNLVKDHKRAQKRWQTNAQDKAKELAQSSKAIQLEMQKVNNESPYGTYEIKEHIDFCFTCIMKTLPLKQHIALILADVYRFKVKETALIINETPGVVKHLLHDARNTMIEIFDNRCALVSKKGVCYQCSELNGYFNYKQNQEEQLNKLDLVKASKGKDKIHLYKLRTALIRSIDPLNSKGAELQDLIIQITRKAIGEI